MINRFRRLLIQLGKVLPFVICSLVFLNYTETVFALATSHYLVWDGMVIPNTELSFIVGQFFEYNLQMLVVLAIISIATETCIYNKLVCLYLFANLIEKSYFDFEVEIEYIYIICILNILACGVLLYKGLNVLLK